MTVVTPELTNVLTLTAQANVVGPVLPGYLEAQKAAGQAAAVHGQGQGHCAAAVGPDARAGAGHDACLCLRDPRYSCVARRGSFLSHVLLVIASRKRMASCTHLCVALSASNAYILQHCRPLIGEPLDLLLGMRQSLIWL